jgi:hypothetical protein
MVMSTQPTRQRWGAERVVDPSEAELDAWRDSILTPGTPEHLLVTALTTDAADPRAAHSARLAGLELFVRSIATNREARRRGVRILASLADRWHTLDQAASLAEPIPLEVMGNQINQDRIFTPPWLAAAVVLVLVLREELDRLAALRLRMRADRPERHTRPLLLHVQSLLAAPRPGPAAGVLAAA